MNSNDKLAEAVRALADTWRESDSPVSQAHAALLNGAIAASILHPSVECDALGEVYEDSSGARFIRQIRSEQLPPAGTKLYAALTPPADKQDGIVVPASLVCEIYQNLSDMPINDEWALRIERKLQPLIAAAPMSVFLGAPKPAAPAPSEADEAVAWMLRHRSSGEVYWDAEVCTWEDASSANDCADDMNENIDGADFEAFPVYIRPQTEPAPDHIPGVGNMVEPAPAVTELSAWKARFPAYEYRPQDDLVALKLEANPPAPQGDAGLADLLAAWEARSRAALPTDAMLINRHIREMRAAIASQAGKGKS